MPKYNKDFAKSSIYKIFCKDEKVKDLYVGETTDFTRRKQQHKIKSRHINKYYHKETSIIYETINLNGGWDNWVMEKIEDFPCNNYDELLVRECYWIMELQASLNMKIRRRDNKEYKKEWYIQHREKVMEKQKQYREAINKIYTIELDLNNLENNPQWYINNKIYSSKKLKI